MKIAFYISNHGYGHASRSAALIEDFITIGIKCHVITDRPSELFYRCNPQYFHVRDNDIFSIDFGLVQNGWMDTDIETTKEKLLDRWEYRADIISSEVEFCKRENIDFIISDIGFLPFEVAHRLGIPSCGVSNFDWYFIYSNTLKADDKRADNSLNLGDQLTAFENDTETHFIVETIKNYYRKASFAVKLPFSSEQSMSGFENLIEGDMLGQYYSEEERTEMRKKVAKYFRLRRNYPIVLISFGGFRGSLINIPELYKTGNYIFAKEYGGWRVASLTRCRFIPPDYPYYEIFAAADIIITKTGYSTFAEAVKQNKMIVYTGRKGNPEDDILLQGLADYPLGYYLSTEEMEKANWVEVFAKLEEKKKSLGIIDSYEVLKDSETNDFGKFSITKDYSKSNRNVSTTIFKNLLNDESYAKSHDKNNRHAIIDVGSNNIQLLWAEITKDNVIPVHRAIQTSAMAKGMKDDYITEEGLAAAKRILKSYLDFSRLYTDNIYVFGTSCSRYAKNIDILGDWVIDEYGVYYDVILEEEETYFVGLANRREFREFSEVVFFDIGGGSCEFVYYFGDHVIFQESIPLGIRRLHNEVGGSVAKQKARIKTLLSELLTDIPFFPKLVGIGGTVTNISAVKQNLTYYDNEKVHKSVLTQMDIQYYIDKFSGMPFDEVKKLMPFDPARAEVIRTGLLIVDEIMNYFKKQSVYVSDYGILFGAAEDIRQKL